jgi:subtilisin family serine protease
MTSVGRTILLCVLIAIAACGRDDPAAKLLGELTPGQKIDTALRAVMRADARVPVLVLGRGQLLPGATAFPEFVERNNSAHRLQLRAQVVESLKRMATVAALLEDMLPAEARLTPLWIVNGAAALLTLPEIERIAVLPEVGYLYALQRALPPATPSGVATTVTPQRRPFTALGRRAGWNVEGVNAPAAWERGVTGEGVVIALLDQPVVLTHTDLIDNIWVNADEVPGNGIDDDRNGYIDDRHGYDLMDNSPQVGDPAGQHGTWVAGILAGDGSTGIITGVAPRARIMVLNATSFLDVALAYEYAIENGADVANMSFSVPDQRNLRGAWRLASDHAVAAGLVLVSGAGNFRETQPIPVQLRTPEDIPSVIAVGGVDASLAIAPFSSIGPVEWASVRFYNDHPMPGGLRKPDIVGFPGPGYPILDLAGGYIDPNLAVRGNSFSSPHAAGAAALLLSAQPGLVAWRVKQLLESSARDIGAAGRDNETGSGLIDVAAALTRLGR